LRTGGVKTVVDRSSARSMLYAWREVGDLTSLNRGVEGIRPGLRHLTRNRSTGRICGGPGWATYHWKTRRAGRILTLEKGMGRVTAFMIPTFGKNSSRDVIVTVIKRDGGGMDGGEEG
jgi:hypothetical protein